MNKLLIRLNKNWHHFTTVRNEPFFSFYDEKNASISDFNLYKVYSPINLVQFGKEELEIMLGMITIKRFFDYTVLLENKLINPFLLKIASNSSKFIIPNEFIVLANKFLVDESYHAVVSNEISSKIVSNFNEIFPNYNCINLKSLKIFKKINSIENILEKNNFNFNEIIHLSCCFASEVSIPNILSIFDNKEQPNFIKKALIDHINDEKKHSIFFIELFRYIWKQMDNNEIKIAKNTINSYIKINTAPDFDWIENFIMEFNFSDENKRQIKLEYLLKHSTNFLEINNPFRSVLKEIRNFEEK